MTKQSCAEYFGTCPNGEKVSQITLNYGSFSCQILTWGATIKTQGTIKDLNRPTFVGHHKKHPMGRKMKH